MREVKFRGYNLTNQKWYYGDLVHYKDRLFIACDSPDECFIVATNRLFVVQENSVGQFTELLDKNKKEIYEGDIIERKNYNGRAVRQVVFINGVFTLWTNILEFWKKPISEWMSDRMYETNVMEDVSIIGNIYENPKLIEK